MKNCPICQSNSISKLYDLYDDRYGYPGFYRLHQCEYCRHKFLDCNFSSGELADLYTDYYPRSSLSLEDFKPLEFSKGFRSWFNGEHRSAYTYVPENIKVLDIGCGFGQSLAYHQSRGCDVSGVEADSNVERVANKYGFDVKVGLFNRDDYKAESFDYVTMDQVLEHVTEPRNVLCGVNKILKDEGCLVLSFPNAFGWGAKMFGSRWINWHAPYHLQFYSKYSMEILAKETGFSIVLQKTVTSSEWLNYQWHHLLSYPTAGDKSIFWASKASTYSLPFKVGFKFISLIHKLKINHIITRLFDALTLGDNVVIILKKKR